MRRLFLILAAMFFTMSANAQEAVVEYAEGYVSPSAQTMMTVEEVQNLNDESRVVLIGSVIQNLGDDKYLFKDSTGTIIVEIDEEEWKGNSFMAEDIVEIIGEVDKDNNEPTKVDVKRIKKVNVKK